MSLPTSTASSTPSPASPTRSAAGAARTRPGTRSRPSPTSAARRGSGSETATSAFTSSARSSCGQGATLSAVDGAARSAASGSGARCFPRPTTRCARSSRRRPGRSRSRSGSSARGHRDEVDALHYTGAGEARPAPGVIEAIDAADVIVIAPSNPYVSIGPILAVEEIRAAARAPPRALRGRQPAHRRPGGEGARRPHARAARRRHRPGSGRRLLSGASIDALVFDEQDAPAELPDGVRPIVTRTLMVDEDARRRLALAVLDAAASLA